MINLIDKDSLKRMIIVAFFAVIFALPLINSNTMFLLKKTQSVNAIMRYSDLVENKIWVEYVVEGNKYFEAIDNSGVVFKKDAEIELLYDIKNPEKAIQKSVKTTKIFCLGVVGLCLISILNYKSYFKGEKSYNDKKAKVVEGKIFEVVNNGVTYRVCMKVEGKDDIFYLDSDINLEPVLAYLKIETLPIYLIGKHFYRVDTRSIEDRIEIVKERIIFPVKKK